MVPVPLFQITDTDEDRIFHLFLLLLDLLVELRVEHFKSWGAIALALGCHSTTLAIGRFTAIRSSKVDSYFSRATTVATDHAIVIHAR